MLMYRTIQSTINTHYSIFPSTTMININYAQAMLVRVIHLETWFLTSVDALHRIQLEPKWDKQQLLLTFHCYAIFKNRFKKSRNCIVQTCQRKKGNTAIIVTSDWFFLHFYWWFSLYLNLILFSICKYYFEWMWSIRNAYVLATSVVGRKTINNN